ncbi:MAG: DegT/DnrJ/EryC1/StrS family aminotransferase [Ruminococcus flavefaciens]|nr:DegT/DnrJ/EryC1/StrS family aminotransferase [Ruminococcus flavefaciens]MCM1230500.1 DegT/DnrJ/EryC1/StrS family aminotransferase [Ruminococcus flavefaciens]
MSIFVTRSSMPDYEEYIEEIKPIFESRHLTNMGPIYKKLQHGLIDYLGVPQLSMFVNGHLALETVFQAMGLKNSGGEVITTPFTFVSTVHAISRNGLKPVFCDIKPNDFTIDPEKIEALITEKTVAIVPVHVYGSVCDVEKIGEIAQKHGLKVIYDAAHAFGVQYKGRGIGCYGDASMFSFHATKVFHTIEGGAVAFSDEAIRENMHSLKNFGIKSEDVVDEIGGNAKMDEFRAAMGICNLRHIGEYIESRGVAFKRYNERLADVKGIRLMAEQKDVVPNYAYYPVIFDENEFGESRDSVYERLKSHDIFARKYFYPAVNEMDCYKINNPESTPIAAEISRKVLTLPMYSDLSVGDVDRICDIILKKA